VTEMVEGDSGGRLPLLDLKERDVRALHDEGADTTQRALHALTVSNHQQRNWLISAGFCNSPHASVVGVGELWS
jgi:hypothetical protein